MKTLTKFSLMLALLFMTTLTFANETNDVVATHQFSNRTTNIQQLTGRSSIFSDLAKLSTSTTVVDDCCGTCTIQVNLLIFSFSYSWCCNKCTPAPIQELEMC